MKILFFGDSITDAERNRDAANDSIKALGYRKGIEKQLKPPKW